MKDGLFTSFLRCFSQRIPTPFIIIIIIIIMSYFTLGLSILRGNLSSICWLHSSLSETWIKVRAEGEKRPKIRAIIKDQNAKEMNGAASVDSFFSTLA